MQLNQIHEITFQTIIHSKLLQIAIIIIQHSQALKKVIKITMLNKIIQ